MTRLNMCRKLVRNPIAHDRIRNSKQSRNGDKAATGLWRTEPETNAWIRRLKLPSYWWSSYRQSTLRGKSMVSVFIAHKKTRLAPCANGSSSNTTTLEVSMTTIGDE